MWQDVLTAFALYLIIEGMIPFVGPDFFRRTVARLAELDDNHLRTTGLTIMASGLLLLFVVRS
ncbi:MAG: DUF2065 domain-containing protein [Gammaproteobacteria bacterium]|nr:MAG: DUF2065 domain-containing protein [Gammaproteobacteria bacterium]